jgi:hypothetical protein
VLAANAVFDAQDIEAVGVVESDANRNQFTF